MPKTILPSEWRVEYFDDDGDDYVTIFVGQEAESRARDYRDAIKQGGLEHASRMPRRHPRRRGRAC